MFQVSDEVNTSTPTRPTTPGERFLEASGIVAGISIVAFATSFVYLSGFQASTKILISPYFLPLDYVQITPQWAVPVFFFPALVILIILALLPLVPAEIGRKFAEGIKFFGYLGQMALLA